MKSVFKNFVTLFTIAAVLMVETPAFAARKRAPHFSAEQLSEIMGIARRIHALKPTLEDAKYMEYAVGIYQAARRYHIDENVLIAIAQRETEFQEGLPEGAAGEHGICQIRKMWLKNKHFTKEFRRQTIADLEKPAKNFMFAAWILHDLKRSGSKGSLPYWSFYNARGFEPRFRYFQGVNRNIAMLLKHQKGEIDAQLAETDNFKPSDAEAKVEALSPAREAKIIIEPVAPPARKAPTRFREVANDERKLPKLNKAGFSQDVQDLVTEGSRWIPDALRRMQKEKEDKRTQSEKSFRAVKKLAAN